MSTSAAAAGGGLERRLQTEREATDAALAGILDRYLESAPADVAEPVRYAIESRGKRLRPLLCRAAWRAAWRRGIGTPREARDADPAAVVDLSCSVELIHGYSLVHDDLPCMDDAPLRRGRPTVHRRYGAARAALAGAALIPLAFRVLDEGASRLGLKGGRRAALARELAMGAGAGGMVGGQVRDLQAEGRALDLAELERVHRGKTGALLVASLRIGARAAEADDATLAALTAYGASVGLAFQIADDLLDVTGSPAVTGKVRGDEVLEKSTFPALLGVHGARDRAVAEARRATDVLRNAGLEEPLLDALARYSAERDR